MLFKAQTAAAAILICASSSLAAPVTNVWSWTANAAAKETFDDNVFLQNTGPRAYESSMVTTLTPQAGVGWKPCDDFNAAIGYSLGANWYHEQPTENHLVHRGTFNFGAKLADTVVESANSVIGIDGSHVGLIWTEPGGAPATGGIAVRDRRDAIIYRNSLRVTQPVGEFFIRPVATYYFHDWGTVHSDVPGYLNFVDRDEFTLGADLGWKLNPDLAVLAGYRFGTQNEEKLLQHPEEYDSEFHRALFGVEGRLTSWLTANASIGPEFRRYEDTVHAQFERSRLNLFVDASLTISPTKMDAILLSAKQFQQPGFGGRSAYTDLTYDFEWRHRFSRQWTAVLAARAYNTHFLAPATRNDWVVGPLAAVNYAITPHLNIELSSAYETGLTTTKEAEGREYDRTLTSVGLKYTFR